MSRARACRRRRWSRLETDSLRRRAFQLVTTSIRAQVFALFLTSYGQLDAVNLWEKRVRRVTSEDVQRVARKYLTPARRTVLTLTPEGKP